MREVMLSTKDNPYDPFTHFEEWYAFDTQKGYNCCSLIDRVCVTSNDFDDQMQEDALEETIDNVIKFLGDNFIKVESEEKELIVEDEDGDIEI